MFLLLYISVFSQPKFLEVFLCHPLLPPLDPKIYLLKGWATTSSFAPATARAATSCHKSCALNVTEDLSLPGFGEKKVFDHVDHVGAQC